MNNKINTINRYVKKCEKLFDSNNMSEIEMLIDEIISVYKNEINGFTSELNIRSPLRMYREISIDEAKEDLTIIKAMLTNYKDNLEIDLDKKQNENNRTNIHINNSSSATNNVNINISLEQIIKEMYDLPTNILSDDEKNELEDKINSLKFVVETENKDKIKNKLNNLVNYALEKGPAAITIASSAITLFNNYIKPLFFK